MLGAAVDICVALEIRWAGAAASAIAGNSARVPNPTHPPFLHVCPLHGGAETAAPEM